MVTATPPARRYRCLDRLRSGSDGEPPCLPGHDERQPHISAAFAPPPNTHILSVQGGAGGSGSVTSTPSGISCTITSGSTSSTCSSPFGSGSNVTLQASAASGSFLKAWAGGGCENNGSGVGTTRGTCAVTMTQAQSIVVSFDSRCERGSWQADGTAPIRLAARSYPRSSASERQGDVLRSDGDR